MIVPVGWKLKGENTLNQELAKINCEGLLDKQEKVIAEETQINLSWLKQPKGGV